MADRSEDLSSISAGDGPALPRSGDVELWISVYTDHLAANRRLLDEITSISGAEVDAEILGHHIGRLEQQLAVWRQRLPSQRS